VNISTEQKDPQAGDSSPDSDADPFDRYGQPFEHYGLGRPHSLGSGFIINKAGYILTNDHVVDDARRILVTLKDGRQFVGRLVGADSKSDIALLKINSEHDLPVAPLGDSDNVRVGEWVMAIGNPFGFDHSVTAGIVSAKGRFIPGNFDDFIQTDASINPGNSGGPLIDLRGAVVGVNSAIYTRTGSNMGIGFAIPVNLVKDELPQLRDSGKVVRGWLGVYIQQVPPGLAEKERLPDPQGAMVAEVIDRGPAANAGIRRGDIIIRFDHRPIEDSQQLPLLVGKVAIGHTVTVEIVRDGVIRELPITIMPSREAELTSMRSAPDETQLGLTVRDLTPKLANELNSGDTRGVIVASITPGSSAAASGLRPHDLILSVNRRAVKNVASYQRVLRESGGGRIVLLLVKRDNGTLFIPLKRQG
ncbi:MAG TPA: Do family serine endopeptidase, partial [Candidatus Binataceae bacterium]|nr:Do family serine endopeptidase [Candidatus Binataceae bacterium]